MYPQLSMPTSGSSPGRLHPLPGFHGWRGLFSSILTLCYHMYERQNHDDRLSITVGGSTKPSEITTERSGALVEGLLWSMHSLSVSSHWSRTVGWCPSGYPHSVGAGCPAFRNPRSTRTSNQVFCPLVSMAAHIWRNYDNGTASV